MNTPRLLSASAVVLTLLACAGCGPENVTACKEYVAARNQAYEDCGMPDRAIDENDTCPASLNEGLNCSDYYQNLADSFQCNGGEVTWNSEGSCT